MTADTIVYRDADGYERVPARIWKVSDAGVLHIQDVNGRARSFSPAVEWRVEPAEEGSR